MPTEPACADAAARVHPAHTILCRVPSGDEETMRIMKVGLVAVALGGSLLGCGDGTSSVAKYGCHAATLIATDRA